MAREPVRPGKVATYLNCPYQYLLDQRIRDSALPMTGFAAKNYWLDDAFQKLFPDERHVGPDLADIESLRGEELAKYLKFHSPDSFASAIRGRWKSYIVQENGTLQGGRKIVWLYENQWWKAAREIADACHNYYSFLMEEGPPVLVFTGKGATTERKLAFFHDGRKYVVPVSFIRKGLVIGEYGTKKVTQKDLDKDWRVTLELLAFSTLARDEEAYRIKWGISDQVVDAWGHTGYSIGPEITYRYYSLSDGTRMETRRTDDDLPEMLEQIEAARTGIAKKDFTARPKRDNCSVCRFNVMDEGNSVICSKKHPDTPTPRPMQEFAVALKF